MMINKITPCIDKNLEITYYYSLEVPSVFEPSFQNHVECFLKLGILRGFIEQECLFSEKSSANDTTSDSDDRN